MARRGRKPKANFWQSSRSTIISGIIAIVVIIGLFVIFNALPAAQPAKQTDNTKTEQSKGQVSKPTANTATKQNTTNQSTVKLPAKHTVAAGDNLWDISIKYYGTGYNWVLIASDNKLANPDLIHPGNVLNIPKAEVKPAQQYTVVSGDCLWTISQRFYGTGFDWTTIRDANPGKIGTLPNGRPLITPGETLAIP
jgi:nucleoid-associated protein YgaU